MTDTARDQGPDPAQDAAQDAAPKLRADAARNRTRLLEAARKLFVASSRGDEISLEQIAREASVGIGTLYRHFPTRLDLIEAVYRDEVDMLRVAGEKAEAESSARDALRAWLEVFLEYAATKHVFHELVEATGRDSALMTHSRGVIYGTAERLVNRAQEAGEIRDDVTSGDVLRLVGGCTMMPSFDRADAPRMLNVVMDGLRVG